MLDTFSPRHINASEEDLSGNHGLGRYILLPGSDGRAKEIAEHFKDVSIKQHERGHHLYLGTLTHEKKKIDVATISTGMGCPSTEIILHELFQLGGKRFLRVGTAGSLQNFIRTGDLINVQASVRDEDTTSRYVPLEMPAIASLEMISAILLAAEKLHLAHNLHTGIVHTKSALYAREFNASPLKTNQDYLQLLTQYDVLASEMETATLFVQSQLYNHQLQQQKIVPENRVLSGAILAVISDETGFTQTKQADQAIKNAIELALLSIKILAIQEHID